MSRRRIKLSPVLNRVVKLVAGQLVEAGYTASTVRIGTSELRGLLRQGWPKTPESRVELLSSERSTHTAQGRMKAITRLCCVFGVDAGVSVHGRGTAREFRLWDQVGPKCTWPNASVLLADFDENASQQRLVESLDHGSNGKGGRPRKNAFEEAVSKLKREMRELGISELTVKAVETA